MQSYSCVVKKNIGINRSARVIQMEGIFDVPPTTKSELIWNVDLPLDQKDWHVGLIVGPSGCGKSTIVNHLWPNSIIKEFDWPKDDSLLDGFPSQLSIKEITKLLQDVGFSSPPNWLRPFDVLSTGEKFRVFVARILAEKMNLAVVDEFTSVIDRTVAKISSVSISKAVRRNSQKFIAVSCHDDILDWLQPDWVYQPIQNIFRWRRLRRFPKIKLDISRVHHKAWQIFKQYHYLSGNHHKGALCFVAFLEKTPVAYLSVLNQPGKTKNRRRGHRIVVLPDYQGVGIGQKFRDHVGSLLKANGLELVSNATAPGIAYASLKSENWQVLRGFRHVFGKQTNKRFGCYRKTQSGSRLTASFKYVGPPYPDINVAKEMIYPSK